MNAAEITHVIIPVCLEKLSKIELYACETVVEITHVIIPVCLENLSKIELYACETVALETCLDQKYVIQVSKFNAIKVSTTQNPL